jgi:outer membrane protein OmpA-like peptidoglycan-associated protein
MRGAIRIAIVPALLVIVSGCATKDWVKDLVGKHRADVDQRVGAQEQKVSSIETRVSEVGDQASQGRARADAAYGRADEVNDRLTRLWNSRHKRSLVETVHVHFGFDRSDLNDAAQTALLGIVKELRENPALSADLEGYADSTGPQTYNIVLSQRRVESVRRYLIERGADISRVHAIGLGALTGGKTADDLAKQRRVTLRLMLAAD